MSPPSSGLKSKHEEDNSTCRLIHNGVLFGLVFETGDLDDVLLRIVGWPLPAHTLIYARGQNPSNNDIYMHCGASVRNVL
jgi:hypothetical protein